MEVQVLKSLDPNTLIWRYVSLDKFINLISGSSLYFTPLWEYVKSDPYEGLPPSVSIRAMASIGQVFYDELEQKLSALERQYPDAPLHAFDELKKIRDQISERPAKFKRTTQALFQGQLVSCWHSNSVESEAMWKLYSDSGKGVAISTTVGALAKALETQIENELVSKIFIGKVRYMDYTDQSITAGDCVVDGHLSPLLKRLSFKHEEEVRAFFMPKCGVSDIDNFKPGAMSISLDLQGMVDGIYISPYAGESFTSAVKAVADKFGFSGKLRESSILAGVDTLFDFID